MITFLLTAILFALLLGLPALRRGFGVLALLALLFMLWATVSNIDDDKRSPSKTDTKHEPPSATDASPSRDGARSAAGTASVPTTIIPEPAANHRRFSLR